MITNSFRQGFVEKPVFANLMKQLCVPFDPGLFPLSCFLTLALFKRKFAGRGSLNIIRFEAIGHITPQPGKKIVINISNNQQLFALSWLILVFHLFRLWCDVTYGLKSNDIEAVTVDKFALEQRQREEAAPRKEAHLTPASFLWAASSRWRCSSANLPAVAASISFDLRP